MAAIALAAALAAAIIGGRPASASASYPGRAGAIAFVDNALTQDPYGYRAINNFDLYAFRPPSRHLRDLSHCSLSAETEPVICPVAAPAFSPDGRKLAFAGDSAHSGVAYPLAIANADGGAAVALKRLTVDDRQPAFLPGGQALVFAGRPTQVAPFDLYTVSSGGTGLTRLTRSGAQQPAPCANGSIAFVHFVHHGDVYLLSPDRRTQRRLTMRGGNSPDCSPDGRWIAFVRQRDLYLISSSGRRVRRLTTYHALDGRPAFSPTGQRIAFTATRACRSHGYGPYGGRVACCPTGPAANPLACSEGTVGVEVIDLRGRARWRRTVSDCYVDEQGGGGCDGTLRLIGMVGLGDVAWQPLSKR